MKYMYCIYTISRHRVYLQAEEQKKINMVFFCLSFVGFFSSVHKFLNIKFTFGKVFLVRHVCTPTSLLYIGRFYIMFHSYTFLADARRTYVSAVEHYGWCILYSTHWEQLLCTDICAVRIYSIIYKNSNSNVFG